jgi:hypothetical protein
MDVIGRRSPSDAARILEGGCFVFRPGCHWVIVFSQARNHNYPGGSAW